MALSFQLLILVTIATITNATPNVLNKPSCQQFSKGVTFNDSQAVGTWHLLHYRTEKTKGSGEMHCVEFSLVNEQEQKDLSEFLGKYVNGLKWERLTLKMQIPCSNVQSNRTRTYFLEKIELNGSYRTLQVPSRTVKEPPSEYHLYPMRLRIIEDQYLGMMDCNEQFVFLMGKESPKGKELDQRLQEFIKVYWPEDH